MTAKPRPMDDMPPVETDKFWPTGFLAADSSPIFWVSAAGRSMCHH
jgi:hypothetical protein